MSAPLLEARSIDKAFPGVRALAGVGLAVRRGEVVAVVGENGAGKSTLMKILAGVQRPDGGAVLVDGRTVVLDSVRAATAHGIALIHQELELCDNLDVAANVFLGREPQRFGIVDRAALRVAAATVLAQVGLDVAPSTPLAALAIGQQQLVEIAKALATDARLLIMDEPTSSLSARETARLLAVVAELRGRGVGVLYITHRLAEVQAIADRVVVLRDGRNAGELARDEIAHDRIVALMVGRDVSGFYRREAHLPGAVRLAVERVRTAAWPTHEVSFAVRAGEVVGVAGLVGAGRSELLRALFGVDRPLAGRVSVDGRELPPGDARAAVRSGVALVPEDRKAEGLVLEMGVRENIALAGLPHRRGVVDRRAERAVGRAMIGRLRIKTPDDDQPVRLLSGGNQQKVVLGKWLARAPRVVLLDEPTRGIDVGAKRELYELMGGLAGAGAAVVFASSDLEEILGVSDRVLVMHEGRLAGELDRDELSEEAVMRLATGGEAAA